MIAVVYIYNESCPIPTTKKQLWLNRQGVIDARSGWPVSQLDRGVLLAVSWYEDEDQGSSPCSCVSLFAMFWLGFVFGTGVMMQCLHEPGKGLC